MNHKGEKNIWDQTQSVLGFVWYNRLQFHSSCRWPIPVLLEEWKAPHHVHAYSSLVCPSPACFRTSAIWNRSEPLQPLLTVLWWVGRCVFLLHMLASVSAALCTSLGQFQRPWWLGMADWKWLKSWILCEVSYLYEVQSCKQESNVASLWPTLFCLCFLKDYYKWIY